MTFLSICTAVFNYFKSSKLARYGLVAVVVIPLVLQYGNTILNTTGKWCSSALAILFPAKIEYRDRIIYQDRFIDRVITKTVVKYQNGMEVTTEKTTEKTAETTGAAEGEKKTVAPVVPVTPAPSAAERPLYLMGGVGTSHDFNRIEFLLGAGYHITPGISGFIQAQKDGEKYEGFIGSAIHF